LLYGGVEDRGCTQKTLEQSIVQLAGDALALFATFFQTKFHFRV
jgi:hypothetical protein